jgi:hypothetical protein
MGILTVNLRSLENIEGIAYKLVTLGIILDHLTTRIGLLNPKIKEFNPFTVTLSQRGLWLPFDIFMLYISVCLPLFIIQKTNLAGRKVILLFPLLFGVARLGAALHNIALILYLA